jgi:hypothetical protein
MDKHTADIVILGGGIAGYAAAMALDKSDVLIIERSAWLGGATTLSNVGTLCGLYYHHESPQLVPHPFCKRFVGELFIHDRQAKLLSLAGNLHVISYEWRDLQQMMTNHLTKKNITLMINSHVEQIETSGNEISSLIVNKEGQLKKISCRRLIDCSGTGVAAQLVNHKMIHDHSYQSAAQVFRLKGVGQSNEYSLNMALKRVMMKSLTENIFPASYVGLSVVPGSLRKDSVDLKLPLAAAITDSNDQQAQLRGEFDQHLTNIISTIRQIESLREAELDLVFPSPGIRVQQRPMGQSILSEDHVRRCVRGTDGIALGTWPIEEWDYKGKVSMAYLEDGDGYSIPASCLSSPQYTNLFFAGKGISADSKAIASARVTGTCLQTGYAAGLLAACNTSEEQKQVINKINSAISSRS